MTQIKRNCDECKKEYSADSRNTKRGWGLCCSKSCAAKKREKSKPGYDPSRVAANNTKRAIMKEEAYERGANRFAKKRGFPSYKDMQESEGMNDEMSVSLSICDICELRADYCRCGGDGLYD
jgi:hypothetical protein